MYISRAQICFFLPVHNPKYCPSVPEGLKETRKAFFQERETKPRFPGSSPWTKFWLIFIFTTYHCHYHLVSNLNPKEANWLLKEMSICHQLLCFLICCQAQPQHWFPLVSAGFMSKCCAGTIPNLSNHCQTPKPLFQKKQEYLSDASKTKHPF